MRRSGVDGENETGDALYCGGEEELQRQAHTVTFTKAMATALEAVEAPNRVGAQVLPIDAKRYLRFIQ